jgi:hypothetical protein
LSFWSFKSFASFHSPKRKRTEFSVLSTVSSTVLRDRGKLFFHLFDDLAECDFIGRGNVGQHLAVDVDVGHLEAKDEPAVGDAERARGRIDACDP